MRQAHNERMVDIMKTIKLNDEIFKEFHIIKKSEYDKICEDYKSTAIFDKKIKCAFLPGYGTTLFFENIQFVIINDNEPTKKYAIWRNHNVIGYCDITEKTAKHANGASNAKFFFGFDRVTNPEKY
jgi:hypothetical protein